MKRKLVVGSIVVAIVMSFWLGYQYRFKMLVGKKVSISLSEDAWVHFTVNPTLERVTVYRAGFGYLCISGNGTKGIPQPTSKVAVGFVEPEGLCLNASGIEEVVAGR